MALRRAGMEHIMSIWTDLLLLGGHAATPRAVAAVAPDLFPARADDPRVDDRTEAPAPARTDDRAATRRADDAAREDLQPQLVRRAEPAPELPRAVARSGRISPNDLFW